ncbi:MAG TPA: bifunctional 2-polyprenyl-6-hydroxyphenol methylase/3-demethylubiquinol 3-O-methyltransferase UbiG [Alphaproteobacteria bacterium]|jgi:2-polyprenyl-6-hydroxyphenyl methylase/3-demethylubiquinone-9 3-methyltransferase|nr:bifunctional 2-polyprenyl-6-hydroxyphenol methylase/3-demethylubiquinol 3-O-methyltransferase UbiG [Alphaproteobacteria bacterium]
MARVTADPEAAAPGSAADAQEVARFEALAGEWWDPSGKFRPLHRLNPTRLRFLQEHALRHFARDAGAPKPLARLRVLDIGCGGGLLCEPLAQLGAEVTGIDPGAATIEAASRHAARSGLAIRYRRALAEELAAEGARFDMVLAMEVVEHVPDLGGFLQAACALVAPGGILVAATLNRTLKSYLLAVVGAEYVLGWLPRGTHDWRKFVRPSELAQELRRRGLEVVELSGVAYNPLGDRWRLSSDLDVNYMALAAKPGEPRRT